MLDLSALVAEVEHTVGVEASAVALIQSLVAQIAANVDHPEVLADLVAKLKDSSDALAAAVAANTPA